jgi:hypothetical protein
MLGDDDCWPARGADRMNWGAFDLNLLIVFDAVMQERRRHPSRY